MSRDNSSTRRSFLKGGALLAAPAAAVSIPAAVLAGDRAALADDRLMPRVERLEDEAAIRELHQSWLRRVNLGAGDTLLDDSVRRITADHAGAPDRIEIAADGRSAIGRFDCAVEVETPLAGDGTLVRMARAQGHGAVRRTERRALTVDYVKAGGAWTIARAASRTL